MNPKAAQLSVMLERINEDFLGLSDDLWLDVDHNDPEKLQAAYEFKIRFNNNLQAFRKASQELTKLMQEAFPPQNEGIECDEGPEEQPEEACNVVSPEITHNLGRNFTYCSPKAYIFQKRRIERVPTWKALLLSFCSQLYKLDCEKFSLLHKNEKFFTSKGNKYFSSSGDPLREAREVPGSLFVETNLSANQIRDLLALLLSEFGFDRNELLIVLGRDNMNNPNDFSNLTLEDLDL